MEFKTQFGLLAFTLLQYKTKIKQFSMGRFVESVRVYVFFFPTTYVCICMYEHMPICNYEHYILFMILATYDPLRGLLKEYTPIVFTNRA